MDPDDPSADRLLLSTDLMNRSDRVSTASLGVLIILIGMAANAGGGAIPISLPNVAAYLPDSADRSAFPARIAELKLAGLLREIRPGLYEVAAGLWKVGPWDPTDTAFFPMP